MKVAIAMHLMPLNRKSCGDWNCQCPFGSRRPVASRFLKRPSGAEGHQHIVSGTPGSLEIPRIIGDDPGDLLGFREGD